jgi:shikimate kinase
LAEVRVRARPEYSVEAMAEQVLNALSARKDVLEWVE